MQRGVHVRNMNQNKILCIDFQYNWLVLKRHLIWAVLLGLIGFLAGLAGSRQIIPSRNNYRAKATVYSFVDASPDQTMLGINAMRTYSEIIKSQEIAQMAAELLNDPQLTEDAIYAMLSTDSRYVVTSTARYENNSALIPVYADSTNRQQSIRVANAAADAFAEKINLLMGEEIVQVLDYAESAQRTTNRGLQQFMIAVGCMVFAAGMTLLVPIVSIVLSPRIQTMMDLSLYGQIRVLGVLPKQKKRVS